MKYAIIGFVLILGAVVFLIQPKSSKVGDLGALPTPIPTSTPALNPVSDTNMITELKIEDITVGTGAEVKNGDTVVVNYKGTLLNGKQFDSSYDRGQPFETKIGVGMVIKGWDVGLLGMKTGGKRKLTIPSNMAYGSQGAGDAIPPNSPLIFELELISIK
jgi:FKBP-type peptidyl-prolyl cis-trans isomerase